MWVRCLQLGTLSISWKERLRYCCGILEKSNAQAAHVSYHLLLRHLQVSMLNFQVEG